MINKNTFDTHLNYMWQTNRKYFTTLNLHHDFSPNYLHKYHNYIKCTVINSIETYVYLLDKICNICISPSNLRVKKIYNENIIDNGYKFYECAYYADIRSPSKSKLSSDFPQIAYTKLRIDNLLLLLNNFVKLESLVFFINRKLVL